MIVKVCDKHGDLTKDMCQLTHYKSRHDQSIKYQYLRCKLCAKEKRVIYESQVGIKEKQKAWRQEYSKRTKSMIRARSKRFKESNRELFNQYEKKRRINNREHVLTLERRRQKHEREILSDNYLKGRIVEQMRIKRNSIPYALIEFKRSLILLKREIIRQKKDDELQTPRRINAG